MARGFSPSSMMGRNGTMISGTVACSSSGADFGLVMSAMTNLDSPRQQPHSLREVLRLRLVEVEHDGKVTAFAKFVTEPIQDHHPALREAAEQKHAFLADCVDD